MSQSRKKERRAKPPASAAAGRRLHRLAAVVLAMAVMAAVGFGWCKSRQAGAAQAVAPVAAVNAADQPAPSAIPKPGFEKLKGRWERPDGGYIIEVRSVEPSGKMDASYFNPQPINVAKAEASQDGETIKVFIELRDVNYPGSTYNLTYDPTDDCLRGIYYQAAIQQSFDVYFVRLKP